MTSPAWPPLVAEHIALRPHAEPMWSRIAETIEPKPGVTRNEALDTVAEFALLGLLPIQPPAKDQQ